MRGKSRALSLIKKCIRNLPKNEQISKVEYRRKDHAKKLAEQIMPAIHQFADGFRSCDKSFEKEGI